MEKSKAGIFDGPQIRQLIRDPEFENSMNEVELEAWKAFVVVVKNFRDNKKPELQHEHQALPIVTYGPVSREPGFNE